MERRRCTTSYNPSLSQTPRRDMLHPKNRLDTTLQQIGCLFRDPIQRARQVCADLERQYGSIYDADVGCIVHSQFRINHACCRQSVVTLLQLSRTMHTSKISSHHGRCTDGVCDRRKFILRVVQDPILPSLLRSTIRIIRYRSESGDSLSYGQSTISMSISAVSSHKHKRRNEGASPHRWGLEDLAG